MHDGIAAGRRVLPEGWVAAATRDQVPPGHALPYGYMWWVPMRRGLLASARQRQPAAPLTKAARAEVDHLLQRLARRDPRARLP